MTVETVLAEDGPDIAVELNLGRCCIGAVKQ